MRLFQIFLSVTLVGLFAVDCGDKKDDKGAGSCTMIAPSEKNIYCYEKKEKDSSFKSTCINLSGLWSEDSCDVSKYYRKCRRNVVETGDEGPIGTAYYNFYYKEGSDFICTGEETIL